MPNGQSLSFSLSLRIHIGRECKFMKEPFLALHAVVEVLREFQVQAMSQVIASEQMDCFGFSFQTLNFIVPNECNSINSSVMRF